MRIAVLLLLGFVSLGNARADEKLWDLLQGGGQVVLVRHTITAPGVGDPPGMRLEDCATQRNLSDEGRAHARRIGQELRNKEVPIGRVLSSPWCRCLETANLAFGRPEISPALSNLFGRGEGRERQVAGMKKLLVKTPKNVFLVSHGSTISALTGVYLGTGEMLIVTPAGDGGFSVRGRIRLD